MPTYEYECQACHSPFEVWFRSFAEAAAAAPACTACGSQKLKRRVSACSVIHAGGETATRGPAASTGGADDDSPQSLARAMRMAGAGRDMGPDFNEVAARLEKGEKPGSVEKSLRRRVGRKLQPH